VAPGHGIWIGRILKSSAGNSVVVLVARVPSSVDVMDSAVGKAGMIMDVTQTEEVIGITCVSGDTLSTLIQRSMAASRILESSAGTNAVMEARVQNSVGLTEFAV